MSVWMELRCDKSAEECAEPNGLFGKERSECWSHENVGPMDMALANQKSIFQTYKEMCEHAKNAGWKKINGEWVCPHCVKRLSTQENK